MSKNAVDNLDKDEKKELRKCESIIRKGAKVFVEVGRALLRIQEAQLYRGSYSTFDEYCKDRWEMSRAHAYRLIESAKVVEDVSETGTAPTREAQARPLSKLRNPQARRDAWTEAQKSSESGKVTAKAVEAAVDKIQGKEKKEIPNVVVSPEADPGKLTLCPDPDGIACWFWHPVTMDKGEPSLFEGRLKAPQYNRPPKNSRDPEDRTVVICPEFDLFQSRVPDDVLESVLEAAEEAPHWTFLIFSQNYERMFSYAYPEHVWAGARITSSKDLVKAEAASLKGKSGTRFLYCSPLTEEITLSVPLPFDWVVIGGSDPKPDWEHVWSLTSQAYDINVPILWAESLETRPEYRPGHTRTG